MWYLDLSCFPARLFRSLEVAFFAFTWGDRSDVSCGLRNVSEDFRLVGCCLLNGCEAPGVGIRQLSFARSFRHSLILT